MESTTTTISVVVVELEGAPSITPVDSGKRSEPDKQSRQHREQQSDTHDMRIGQRPTQRKAETYAD